VEVLQRQTPGTAIATFEQELRQALALRQRGLSREAEIVYHGILRDAPDCFVALHELGAMRLQQGDPAMARTLIERAIAANPQSAQAYNNLGTAFQSQNRQEESIEPYRRAIAIDPNFADAHNNLGIALKVVGSIAEAIGHLEGAVALAPGRPELYRNLFETRRVERGDPQIAGIEKLAREMDKLAPEQQVQLHFALGKMYSDLGLNQESFSHFLAGNALKRRQIVYDEGNTMRGFERTRQVFSVELMRARRGGGDASQTPVFVFGMPRSGTSLIEQILASHPRVFGAGELIDFEALALGVHPPPAGPLAFPEVVNRTPLEGFAELGRTYAERARARGNGAARVIDKMPANFRYAGLIHLALPEARLIHVRRDPVDTCLSCFSILFSGSQPHSYDLGELGRYYAAYARLMEHWRSVIPAGAMIEVRYEDVVADIEGQARRMIAHCGLEWDDACLSFHETRRAVRTASAVQVRQPLFRSARWRPSEQLLGPLLEGLAG
jgi:tetratricopeptide (TPR) repeat protein